MHYSKLPETFYDFGKSRQWQAKWISPPDCEQKAVRFLFRKELWISSADKTKIFISAGKSYELYINGTYVHTGVPPSQPHWKYYDDIDLSRYLINGKNCIGVIVSAIGEPCGLLIELEKPDGIIIAQTDNSWRVCSQNGWCIVPNYNVESNLRQEIFDARKHPQGWFDPGFDDSNWPETVVRENSTRNSNSTPWYRLLPRDIPLLCENEFFPVKVVALEEGQEVLSRGRTETLSVRLSAAGRPIQFSNADKVQSLCSSKPEAEFCCSTEHLKNRSFDGIWCPSVVLDFGKVLTGVIEIELNGLAGAIMELGYVERLLNGHFNNALEVPYADQYILRDGKQVFRCAIWKSFRYVKLRFLQCFQPLTITNIRAIQASCLHEPVGFFKSGDEKLNKIFDISLNTIKLCSRDYFMDSPWREKCQWSGDVSAVILGSVYACFGDTSMPGKFLRQAAVNQCPHGLLNNLSNFFVEPDSEKKNNLNRSIPDYSLWWLIALWEHYMYSGQEAYLNECYPVVTQIILWHFNFLDETGFICGLPGWIFIDHVFNCKAEELAVYNAIFYGALGSAEKIAKYKNDEWMQKKIGILRQAIKNNYHDRYYNKRKGVYIDGYDQEKQVDSVSEHTNMAAIFFGLCPEDIARDIVHKFYTSKSLEFLEAEPFFTAVVIKAIAACGCMNIAIEIIQERWGKRMVDAGMTSTTEEWNATGSWRGDNNSYIGIYRSLSHAWSACPAEFLIKALAGIEIIEAGCKKVRVKPTVTLFDYKVVYPTPSGNIQVLCCSGKTSVSVVGTMQIV